VPALNVWNCDPHVPLEIYAIFDPLGNAAHTALSYDLVGEDVLITGAGPIGIAVVAMALKAGARFVVITDISEYRLELARKVGVTRAVDVRTTTVAQVQEELGMTQDNPGDWISILIESLLWPDHPLGRDVGGTRQTVSSISRADLLEYLAAHYGPRNLVVSVAGNIDTNRILDLVRHSLEGWKQGNRSTTCQPATERRSSRRLLVQYKKTEQANLSLAALGLSRRDPDRYALAVLNAILGEGMTSRLFFEIREKQSLAYDVHSYIEQFADTGALVIYAGVDPTRIEAALEGILGEVERLKTQGADESELAMAREYFKGRTLLGLENTQLSNPDGRDAPNNYTSALDIALLGRELMSNPVLRKIAGTQTHAGVAAGEPLTVATDRGSVTLPAELTEMPDRVVWLPTNSPGCRVRSDLGAGAGTLVRLSREG